MSPRARRRAYAYITRERHGRRELLVFRHKVPDAPEAGIQVPGGTIEGGETPESGALREAYEESGLERFDAVRHLATDLWVGSIETIERHYFQLEAADDAPDRWDHRVSEGAGDKGMVFHFFWVPLDRAGAYLSGVSRHMGDYLHLLAAEPRQA